MKKTLLLLAIFIYAQPATAMQSSIQVAEGMACMGYDKSRKQTENEAVANAKRNASEFVSTTIRSQTDVVDFELQKDLVQAFSDAAVRMIKTLESSWHEEQGMGTCYHISIQAEVIPNEVIMAKVESSTIDDPSAPLNVRIWTNKPSYAKGDKVKVLLKGNKPFFGRVVYKDAAGNFIQLLPNPHRKEHYFEGGSIYEIPSGHDRFEMEVTAPFGTESITVYASTEPTGGLAVEDAGSVYLIETKPKDIALQTRGIQIQQKNKNHKAEPSEFSEVSVSIETKESI